MRCWTPDLADDAISHVSSNELERDDEPRRDDGPPQQLNRQLRRAKKKKRQVPPARDNRVSITMRRRLAPCATSPARSISESCLVSTFSLSAPLI